jgi:formylglycine-generating enzyme required for sulfatase activity
MLAETLARFSRDVLKEPVEMSAVRPLLEAGDHGLADWLRGRKQEKTAFLLAVDQFEELFTFADPDERAHFDRLLATALEDADCPLFLISTVRADFLDRFEELPRLVSVRNRYGRDWTLPPVGEDGLREVIDGPARLAGLDAGEVRDAIVANARDEAGALPLVENALHWLWERRRGARLSGERFHGEGGLAGILSRSADGLLKGLEPVQRERALKLLFRLVKVDPEGRRHTRRRMPLAEAVEIAGRGEQGRRLIDHLAGSRTRDGGQATGPLRLITVTEETGSGDGADGDPFRGDGRWVNLIHETLIRSKGKDAHGKPQPYWRTLWDYVEEHKAEAVAREADSLLALKLAWQIEQAAAAWAAGGRDDKNRWSEELFQDTLREISRIGRAPGDLVDSDVARAFLGPADPEECAMRLALGEDQDAARGGGRYGDAWRLPLGQEARARLGERLGILGDTRPGVGVGEDGSPSIDWVAIPGGSLEPVRETGNRPSRGLCKWLPGFLRGVDGVAERDSLNIQPFHMSRYLVTNAQFQAFVEATDGYRSPDWWQDMPVATRDGPKSPRWLEPNRPRETLSWYEAVAFCRWLSHRLGFEVGLPDEWQWQHAATSGDPGNVYPWGREWDANRCNTWESGLERTTAVGLYPAGGNAQGVLDLAGNLWEWCLNKYDRPSDKAVDESDESRVLRGGSWGSGQDYARADLRGYAHPDLRRGLDGFRVVCSSPIR